MRDLNFRPGVDTESTALANSGGYINADKVRFRQGHAETIGGWQAPYPFFTTGILDWIGAIQTLHAWQSTSGDNLLFVGCDRHLFVMDSESPFTEPTLISPRILLNSPILKQVPDEPNLFTVTPTAPQTLADDDIIEIEGAGALDGIYVPDTNGRFETLADIPETLPANATIKKIPAVGNTSPLPASLTWGAAGYGEGTYGINPPAEGDPITHVQWRVDNYGEDLIISAPNQEPLYYDHSEGTCSTLSSHGADAPDRATQIFVADNARRLIALAASPLGSLAQEPLLVRFSSIGSPFEWRTADGNTAGGRQLTQGSRIVGGLSTQREILVWTEGSLHSLQPVGLTYSDTLLSGNTQLISGRAMAQVGNSVFWMGDNQFYRYDGQVQALQCTVLRHVFGNLNRGMADSIHAGVNLANTEVWWWYPSAQAMTPDRYVLYNYAENVWSIGTMKRNAWVDAGTGGLQYPLAADDGTIWQHEDGWAYPGESGAVLEAADLYLDGHALLIDRLFADIRRLDDAGQLPDVQFQAADKPEPGARLSWRWTFQPGGRQSFYVRERGAYVRLRFTGGGGWRLGVNRINIVQAGQVVLSAR